MLSIMDLVVRYQIYNFAFTIYPGTEYLILNTSYLLLIQVPAIRQEGNFGVAVYFGAGIAVEELGQRAIAGKICPEPIKDLGQAGRVSADLIAAFVIDKITGLFIKL